MSETHASVAINLLQEAAAFFVNLGEENAEIKAQMEENSKVFIQMADLLTTNPTGLIDGQSHGVMAGRLMQDAANFFRALGEQNEPIKEQMEQNAEIYDHIAALVSTNPTDVMK